MTDTKNADNDIRHAIAEQLKKLEDDTEKTSASNFYQAQKWEKQNTYLGLAVIVLSGLVTAIGTVASQISYFEPYKPELNAASIILAAVVSVVGTILTFLKPAERASGYREYGNKQKSLRNKIRIYRTTSMLCDTGTERAHEKLQGFLTEKDALNSDNPPVPREAFQAASKEIAEKRKRDMETKKLEGD